MPTKVLVVDDNVDHADSLAAILRNDGYDAKCAYTGTSAVRVASEFQPDVILLDLGMPDKSGHQVLQDLPEPRPKVIAVTGRLDREEIIQTGFCDHLAKPVDYRLLAEALNRLKECD